MMRERERMEYLFDLHKSVRMTFTKQQNAPCDGEETPNSRYVSLQRSRFAKMLRESGDIVQGIPAKLPKR